MTPTGSYIFPSQVVLTPELRQLCLRAPSMRPLLDMASDTLSMDFRAILRDASDEEANDPRFRRPLINMMGIAGYKEELRRGDLHPVCVTGISLGFLSAAAAAGWVSMEDMVRMSNTMASIEMEVFEGTDLTSVFFYNCDYTKVFEELRAQDLDSLLHMSVVVSSNQFIAACHEADVRNLRPALAKAGALFKVIPYSFPGHCDLMGEVKTRFAEEWTFRDPCSNLSIPIVSINDGRPYTSSEAIWELATEQYTTVLQWNDVLSYLEGLDLDGHVVLEPSDFVLKAMSLDPSCGLKARSGGILDVSE
ncbi:hypothetical protein GCM10009799_46730 [Nocardiopsis rhodophaea]|uniref:[acyl-carrier-protein] S-malonyltransferase n=1 Tax=Nocardiopsis rhodophaea TaxID=280238 RepID=A0ABP5F2T0_9ACTN